MILPLPSDSGRRSRPITESAVMLLPQPDSPTNPTVLPDGIVSEQVSAEKILQVTRDRVAANGDMVPPGLRSMSTTNRNFEGRQGPQSRTHLASPAMVAAAAVTGRITDVRRMMG